MLDKKLQNYYEDRFSMMATQGWLDLLEDLGKMIESTDTLGGLDSLETLYYRKGELSIMTWLKTLKQSSESAYEGLENEGT